MFVLSNRASVAVQEPLVFLYDCQNVLKKVPLNPSLLGPNRQQILPVFFIDFPILLLSGRSFGSLLQSVQLQVVVLITLLIAITHNKVWPLTYFFFSITPRLISFDNKTSKVKCT